MTVSVDIAQQIVGGFEAYMLAGLVFAALFLPRGVARLDPRVAGSPKTLRLVILPGIVALWPLLAWRWITGAREPIEDNPHRAKARESLPAARRSRELAR
jgi:hypothetical protein